MPTGIYKHHPQQGFQKGHTIGVGNQYAKGKIAWNKGKKISKKIREKLSISHMGKIGPKASNWKGGITKKGNGYILVYCPKHPFHNSQNYILRSHFVIEQMLGRFVIPGEIVHHRNGVRDDDRIQNLQLFKSNSKHRKFHESI